VTPQQHILGAVVTREHHFNNLMDEFEATVDRETTDSQSAWLDTVVAHKVNGREYR
jgi:hypothetical protein